MAGRWLLTMLVCVAAAPALADVTSGPATGAAVPALKLFGVVGEVQGEEVEFVERRGQKPTIYALIPSDKWSRPVARLLRKLDEDLGQVNEAALVAVWLTDDKPAAKAYLPKAQVSLNFQRTALGVFEGEKAGPQDWGINLDADVTIVVVKNGAVVSAKGYVSANDTLAAEILATLGQ